MKTATKTIYVSEKTWAKFAATGKYGETADDILARLIDEAIEYRNLNRFGNDPIIEDVVSD